MKDEALELALEALEGVLDDAPKVLDASIAGGLYEVVQCRDAITAIKQALALDKKAENARQVGLDYEPVPENFMDALKFDVAMRDAAPVQEPVAWAVHYNGPIPLFTKTKAEAEAWGGNYILPLYTTPPAQPAPVQEPEGKCKECLTYNGHQDGCHAAPPAAQRQWVGLTAEEIEKVWQLTQANDFHDCVQPFAQAIEAALKERNR